MAPSTAISGTTGRWILGALIAVLAIGAIALTLLALDHVRMASTNRDLAPVPTFTQTVQQPPPPTPSETITNTATYDRSQERFLTASAGVLWRGTAGHCGDVEPLVERSADGGQTWADVTPRYLEINQLVSLNPFAEGQAEMVALIGVECEVQALRTFTQGQFWESYEDVLGASQYVDPTDSGNIVRPEVPIAGPCSDVRVLRTAGPVLATVCNRIAHVLDQDGEWTPLPLTDVAALYIDGGDIVVVHDSEQCIGLTLTRYSLTGDEEQRGARCVEDAKSGSPTAVAVSGDDVLIWSEDEMAVVSQ